MKGISVSSIGLIIKKHNMFYQLGDRDKMHREYKRGREGVEDLRHREKGSRIHNERYIGMDDKEIFNNAIDVERELNSKKR